MLRRPIIMAARERSEPAASKAHADGSSASLGSSARSLPRMPIRIDRRPDIPPKRDQPRPATESDPRRHDVSDNSAKLDGAREAPALNKLTEPWDE